MTAKKKTYLILLLIIIVAIALRFSFLHTPDVIHDESINGFRSLNYVDWLANPGQLTPYDWFEEIPWWVKLSFHDHPPLTFIINWFSFKLFGPTPFAIRFFSALAGVISVFLIYLIGKINFGKRVGLIAAFILAINNFFVWLGRIGLQESILIAFILASFYYFSLGVEKRKYLYLSALFFGLGFLAKYTIIFLVPVYFFIILFKNKKIFAGKNFILSLLLILILISPVIIYNLKLYQTRGHFDLQLSYLLGQKVDDWSDLPGKSKESIPQRFAQIIPSFYKFLSPLFLLVLLFSIAYLAYKILKDRQKNYWLILLPIIFITILLGFTGPQERFLTLYLPFFALALAIFWRDILLWKKLKIVTLILFILFIGYETFYSINHLRLRPFCQEVLCYSNYLYRNRGSWGFNQLEQYLEQELTEKKAALRFQYSSPPIEKIALNNHSLYYGEEVPILLIYDFNIKPGPVTWYLRRREFYQGFPVQTVDFFLKELKEKGSNYYLDLGFNKFYFIQATKNTLLIKPEDRSEKADILAQSLLNQGIEPEIIYNLYNEPVFKVFAF